MAKRTRPSEPPAVIPQEPGVMSRLFGSKGQVTVKQSELDQLLEWRAAMTRKSKDAEEALGELEKRCAKLQAEVRALRKSKDQLKTRTRSLQDQVESETAASTRHADETKSMQRELGRLKEHLGESRDVARMMFQIGTNALVACVDDGFALPVRMGCADALTSSNPFGPAAPASPALIATWLADRLKASNLATNARVDASDRVVALRFKCDQDIKRDHLCIWLRECAAALLQGNDLDKRWNVTANTDNGKSELSFRRTKENR